MSKAKAPEVCSATDCTKRLTPRNTRYVVPFLAFTEVPVCTECYTRWRASLLNFGKALGAFRWTNLSEGS